MTSVTRRGLLGALPVLASACLAARPGETREILSRELPDASRPTESFQATLNRGGVIENKVVYLRGSAWVTVSGTVLRRCHIFYEEECGFIIHTDRATIEDCTFERVREKS